MDAPGTALPAGPAVVVSRRPVASAALPVTAVLCALYFWLQPAAPDLAAQVARASAVSRGVGLWWAGWYGGINTFTYSLVSATLMHAVGVAMVGVLSTLAVAVAGADLARSSARPRRGALAAALAACANLYSGRITFAAGMAVALASLCALRRGRVTLAVLAGAVSGVVSPLAALFELTVLTAALLTHRPGARALVGTGAACMLPVGVVAVVFGQPSYMPFSSDVLALTLLACLGVLLAPVPRLVRTVAVVSAALAVVAFFVPSPIGSNAARIPMLAAAPVLIATARRSSRLGWVLAGALVIWPAVSFASDMAVAGEPSSQAAFYAPLLARLPAAGTATQRVEVVDPLGHAAAYYVSRQVPLARGWERQVDAATNGLFYVSPLRPEDYRAWLVSRAVGWVAVPTGHVDYSAVEERALVDSGLPYLHLVWASPNWRLYRVTVPAPVAGGVLRATRLTDTGVELAASGPGQGEVRVPFSRQLTLLDGAGDAVGCVLPSPDGDTTAVVPGSGRFVLTARLSALGRGCPAP